MKQNIRTIFLLMVFICIGYADALQKPLADIKTKVNEANVTRSVEVINVTPTLSSLSLESNATTVNVGETVQLSVVGTYSDNSTNIVDENITYIITPVENAEVNGSVLTALKDGNVTVQAKVGITLSNAITLNIIWVVNGHTLPPEPDPAVNNSTLLGVDVNNNGVRDDVERWIYKTYKDKHPIYIDIAMQGAKTKQIMLKDPTKAKKIHNIMVAPILCESYYKVCIDTPIIKEGKRINSKFFRKIIFNTKERMDAYIEYDDLLSGDSYTVPWCSERKQLCDFNTSKYGK